jgi:hypothetical protein
MARSERSWARTFVKRGLVAAIMILALAVYGLLTAGTQSLSLRPTATSTSTSGGHSVSQAMSPANNSINVAAQGPSHSLYFYWELYNSSTSSYTGVWNGPLGVGAPGSTFSAPKILAQSSGGSGTLGNFDIAVEGPNHTGDLYWDISGTWYGPYQFAGPGIVMSTPGMVEDSDGNLQITVQGPANTLYAYWNTAGAFYGPLGIGGPNSTFSGPTMQRAGNLVDAAVQGPNHSLRSYSVYDGGSTPSNGTPWSSATDISNDNTEWDIANWGGVGGNTNTNGIIFQGPNNSLYEAITNPTFQLDEIRGAGTTYSTPSGLSGGNYQYIAAEGPSNTLYWYFEDPNTVRLDGPLQIGGVGSTWSAPSLIFDASGNFDIAVQGANHALYEYFDINGVMHGPLGIGAAGSTFSSPT